MHERHLIFVNMMSFDKTNLAHRQSVENIFQNLFEEGKKRGYSKYRSHVNAMGKTPGTIVPIPILISTRSSCIAL